MRSGRERVNRADLTKKLLEKENIPGKEAEVSVGLLFQKGEGG